MNRRIAHNLTGMCILRSILAILSMCIMLVLLPACSKNEKSGLDAEKHSVSQNKSDVQSPLKDEDAKNNQKDIQNVNGMNEQIEKIEENVTTEKDVILVDKEDKKLQPEPAPQPQTGVKENTSNPSDNTNNSNPSLTIVPLPEPTLHQKQISTPEVPPNPRDTMFEKPKFKGTRAIYFDDNDELRDFVNKVLPKDESAKYGSDYFTYKDRHFSMQKMNINYYNIDFGFGYEWSRQILRKLLDLTVEDSERIYNEMWDVLTEYNKFPPSGTGHYLYRVKISENPVRAGDLIYKHSSPYFVGMTVAFSSAENVDPTEDTVYLNTPEGVKTILLSQEMQNEINKLPENSITVKTDKLLKYKDASTGNKIAIDQVGYDFYRISLGVGRDRVIADEEKAIIYAILNKTTEDSDTIYKQFMDSFEAMYCSDVTQTQGQKIYDSVSSKWYTSGNVKYMINSDIYDLSVYYKDSERVRDLYKSKIGNDFQGVKMVDFIENKAINTLFSTVEDKYNRNRGTTLSFMYLDIMTYYEDGYSVEYGRTYLSDDIVENKSKIINLFFEETTEIPKEMQNLFWELNDFYMDFEKEPREAFCLSFNLANRWHKLGNIEFQMNDKGQAFLFRSVKQ